MNRLLVILDLDETLVYASDTGVLPFLDDRDPDFWIGSFPVYKRPEVDEFLTELFKEFDVAVWTSSSPGYAGQLTRILFKNLLGRIKFIWDSTRCSIRYDHELVDHCYYAKNLKKVRRQGYYLSRVVAVDDTPAKYKQSYGNLIRVPEYLGEPEDTTLPKLLNYLRWLNTQPDVRKVEKRGWLTRENI
jgi:RNA polymerase II subunit A small phosphatase-like protein